MIQNNLQLFSYSARHANIVRNSYLEGRGVLLSVYAHQVVVELSFLTSEMESWTD